MADSKRLKGQGVVTCSKHDFTDGTACTIASHLSGANVKSIAGPGNPFGGLGANGPADVTRRVRETANNLSKNPSSRIATQAF